MTSRSTNWVNCCSRCRVELSCVAIRAFSLDKEVNCSAYGLSYAITSRLELQTFKNCPVFGPSCVIANFAVFSTVFGFLRVFVSYTYRQTQNLLLVTQRMVVITDELKFMANCWTSGAVDLQWLSVLPLAPRLKDFCYKRKQRTDETPDKLSEPSTTHQDIPPWSCRVTGFVYKPCLKKNCAFLFLSELVKSAEIAYTV